MSEDYRLEDLREREKELECLYRIDEALAIRPLGAMLLEVSRRVAMGFRDAPACRVAIDFDGEEYASRPAARGGWEIHAGIVIHSRVRGRLTASYPAPAAPGEKSPFLAQEQKLLQEAALKLSHGIMALEMDSSPNWREILKLLQVSDRGLLRQICDKMLSLLAAEHQEANDGIFQQMNWEEYGLLGEINAPLGKLPEMDEVALSETVFNAAAKSFTDQQIYENINLWIFQRKTYDLISLVNRKDIDVKEISKGLSQYLKAVKQGGKDSEATRRWVIVELARRFLTDDPRMIETIRQYVRVEDFSRLLESYIASPYSAGRIGGKAAGFFVANCILRAHTEQLPALQSVRQPRTWYLSSNEMQLLLTDNGLEEFNEHKYRDPLEIRVCYPKMIQTIKSLRFTGYLENQLSGLLDQCEDVPLIIRSSGELEDQAGASFSGKYKSLFIPNSGTKAERLGQLTDGILEIYASVFNPDVIQYCEDHGLLDRTQAMGVMIQEVVGSRVGPYYFPLYAGVAFSTNELRWSPRIRREDGLLRMVMGLGTRAVDRVGNDYPVMVSPGHPGLTVNHTTREMEKYSQRQLDAVDLEQKRFTTLPVPDFLRKYGKELPHIEQIISVVRGDFVQPISPVLTDFEREDFLVTFDGLIRKTRGVDQLKAILALLKERLGYAVDVEFAGDGEFLYLLQCRPQSQSRDSRPAPIPADIPAQSRLFTANRHVSNGTVAGIRTIIYVDPAEYAKLKDRQDFINVACAVREMNKKLPCKSFILLGPGRWGSRGDFTLGVPVTYSDISNTAMLIEVATRESKYHPELSFGTHFFQDLVEANIKYLPLYAEDQEVFFDKGFFTRYKNHLPRLSPAFGYLDSVIRVAQVEENFPGKELVVLMNADLERAVAYLRHRHAAETRPGRQPDGEYPASEPEGTGWKWRFEIAGRIAALMDLDAYGVQALYLFGSTNSCTARLNSDIDLLVHYDGTAEQLGRLKLWLNGWSLALDEINCLKTGYRSGGLLDVHYVNDLDILSGDSYAMHIKSVYDPALLLRRREISIN